MDINKTFNDAEIYGELKKVKCFEDVAEFLNVHKSDGIADKNDQ